MDIKLLQRLLDKQAKVINALRAKLAVEQDLNSLFAGIADRLYSGTRVCYLRTAGIVAANDATF